MPSPELQSPFSCTWKAWTPSGLRPVSCALTRTLSPCWVKVTVPLALLPPVGSRLATALGPPLMPMVAQPAARPQEATSRIDFFNAFSSPLLLALGLGFFLALLGIRLGLRLRA